MGETFHTGRNCMFEDLDNGLVIAYILFIYSFIYSFIN